MTMRALRETEPPAKDGHRIVRPEILSCRHLLRAGPLNVFHLAPSDEEWRGASRIAVLKAANSA